MHHPTLDEFTLLPGITAVDDTVGCLHQFFNDAKLFLDAFLFFKLDTESWRNHRQVFQSPIFPFGGIFVRLFQFAQMAKRPRHLVAITLHEPLMLGVGSDDAGNVACHTRFLSNTNYHFSTVNVKTFGKGTTYN